MKIAPESIEPERLLLLDEGHCLADQALAVCGLKREAARVDLGASSLATLCGLVGAGFGLTFLPELAIESEAEGLSLIRFPDPEPFRTVGLVCRDLGAPAGWFEELSTLLRQAGDEVIARAKARWPRVA